MKWPANRITDTSKKSFGMFEKALALEAAGHDLIHLEFGKPVHDTPQHIKDAAIAALQAGKVHYSDLCGEPALRAALAAKLAADNGIAVGPDGVLVTNGLTHAAYLAFMASIDPGDEVILLDPYYPQHINKIELAGGVPVFAPLDRADGFAIRAEWIERRITPRTRMIVLVNPSNPTGRVYSRAELEAVAALAIQHDLLVVTDEVYEHVLYDGAHISIASLPGMAERTLSLFAFTKAYAMDGWRLGYIAAPPAMIPALLKIAMNDVTHVNTFIQYGALAAVADDQASRAAMVADDRDKRDYVVRRLNQMPGVTCASPEATIYAFANIEGTGRDSTSIATDLLEQAHVVVEDGAFYGVGGRGHIRICFGSEPMPRIEQAMDRLSGYFNALPGTGGKDG
ncbi:pyridoxal phosphate-dependent aminotransferase [Sphingomonas flavalba]|uniref:pyridoxal phosphate-dependent aminotransferase n=1 Tax=Sphingomonas flavalba TaxID=2559804 RepID=UPI0039E09D26